MIHPGDLVTVRVPSMEPAVWGSPRALFVVGTLRSTSVGLVIGARPKPAWAVVWMGYLVAWDDGRVGWTAERVLRPLGLEVTR